LIQELSMQSYNGFSPEQRYRKARAMHLALSSGELAPPTGPCQLCGDPRVPVEFHDEDYSEPFSWVAPAAYCICRDCHRRVHQRFTAPLAWLAFVAHVRRGGYARDLLRAAIRTELARYQQSLARGEPPPKLTVLRARSAVPAADWFSKLQAGGTRSSRAGRPLANPVEGSGRAGRRN
jgi:hypothetical protein